MSREIHSPVEPALLLFGFALAVIGAELVVTESVFGALVFALPVAGVANAIGGGWALVRRETAPGTALLVYGFWLTGAFLLVSLGRVLGVFSRVALAAYFLAFLPVAALVVRALVENAEDRTLSGAFGVLVLYVAADAVQFLVETPLTEAAAGLLAWVSALLLWIAAARRGA